MTAKTHQVFDVLIVAVPETAGSALYGMLDVLLAVGNIWQVLVREEAEPQPFQVRILSPSRKPKWRKLEVASGSSATRRVPTAASSRSRRATS